MAKWNVSRKVAQQAPRVGRYVDPYMLTYGFIITAYRAGLVGLLFPSEGYALFCATSRFLNRVDQRVPQEKF